MIKVNRCVSWTLVCGIVAGVALMVGCGGDGGGAADGGQQPQATGSISGTVLHAGTGLALGGIQVAAGGVTTTTASDGTFTLSGVPVGQQQLTVTPDPARNLAVPPGADNLVVTVQPGQNTTLADPILVIDAPDWPPNPPS